MHDETHIPIRCAPDDPRRCQNSVSFGQCPFLALPNTTSCSIHSSVPIHKREEKNLYNFNRTEVLSRLQSFKNNPESRTLAIELGILRLLLEEVINKCAPETQAYDLLAASPQITVLIDRVRDTLLANVKLEEKVGDLMSVEQVVVIAQALYNIICNYITDVEVLNKIAQDFELILCNRGKKQ